MLKALLLAVICTAAPAAQARPWFAARGPTSPATRPAGPVEHLSAIDQPLDLGKASGNTAQWLRQFAVEPRRFDYTLQLLEDNPAEKIRVYRLVFPSPFKSPFPVNNVVPCEYYVPRDPAGKLTSAIVLDILAGNAIVARALARGMAEHGVAALYVPMAYYNSRRPKDHSHLRWLKDPDHLTDPPRQTIMDVRRAKAILASRPENDAKKVSITGVSLGGIMTSIAAGVDGHFARVVPILAGGDLAALTFHAPETRRARQQLLARGIDQQRLEKLMAPIEPLHFASRIDPTRCLMINASRDEVIPHACTLELWKAIGRPELLWVPSGHYSAAWFMMSIERQAIDFIKGSAPTLAGQRVQVKPDGSNPGG